MAIRDKHGNVVKLVGPNPLMKTQDNWDFKHVKLINCGWKPIIVSDTKNPIEKFKSDYDIPDITNMLKEISIPIENTLEVASIQKDEVTSIQEDEEKPKEVLFNKNEFIDKHKIMFLCVLAKETTVNDELYGDSYTPTVYGDKFQFSAIIIKQSDVMLEIWTESDITINSIVYPQNDSKRWWKIKSSFAKSGGNVITAITSDVNPDFS